MRKTKIIATIGPSTDTEEMLEKMILHGLNVARINMSHGSYKEHLAKIIKIRKINERLGTNVAIMLDTKGPEIRLGEFKEGKALLVTGKTFRLTTNEIEGTETEVTINHKNIVKDVSKGTEILLNDGLISLSVTAVGKDYVDTIINNTGVIKSRKGVNIPKIKLSLPSFTDTDKEDIKFGVVNDIEYIAASFIRKASDVEKIKKYIDSLKGKNIKVIAKVENEEGIANFKEILEVSDGVMVARGDMGVEVPIYNLPIIQKEMIKQAIKASKPVITATQMLESMITNPRPTRAEVSDVANAIFDGTSAIMLSEETAMGSYPIECIDMMVNIAEASESSIDYWNRFKKLNIDKMGAYAPKKCEDLNTINMDDKKTFRKQINFSICSSAMFTNAKAIISISDHGKTPAVISGYRPACPIYVITANYKTYLQMSLSWGICAIYIKDIYNFEDILKMGIEKLLSFGHLIKGDIVMLGGGTTPDHMTENYLSSQTMGAVIRI